MSSIYLDNNATTPLFPEVMHCMTDAWATAFANPGSQHSYGREARRVLEDGRESIAEILNADASEVIFTSGGTESINMAIHGFTFGRIGTIAITAGEHPATLMACERARQNGWQIATIPVDEQGRLDEARLPTLPWKDIKLVCVILAHNETGVIQNVSRLATLCRQNGAALLLDAVQAVGKIPVDFQNLGATAMAFGAHKFHGPRGIGGLLLKRGVKLPPLLEGGHQENGRRAGTEPVPLIAGMTKALQIWAADSQNRSDRIRTLRDQLQEELIRRCSPVVVHSTNADRLMNTLSIAFPESREKRFWSICIWRELPVRSAAPAPAVPRKQHRLCWPWASIRKSASRLCVFHWQYRIPLRKSQRQRSVLRPWWREFVVEIK
ncbi:MAG: cysteine desulfurase family protein [Planctomycetaceae bacterium]